MSGLKPLVLQEGSQFIFLKKKKESIFFPLTLLSPSSTAYFLPVQKVPVKRFVMFVFAQSSINYALAGSTGNEEVLCSPSGYKIIQESSQ